MPALQRIRRPVTHKGKKFLINKQPKLVENHKQTIFLHGRKTSPVIVSCMKDVYHLKKPDGKLLSRKHDVLPFENITPIEELARKNNTSLFMFASHNKKRPNNLILGRMYDYHLLDMVELGVDSYKSLLEFKNEKVSLGIKPCLLFAGEQFEQNHEFQRLKSLLIDMFKREDVTNIRLKGLEHVLLFTAVEDKIYMRSYRILLKKSGTRLPRVELEEIGPSVDFRLRRTKLASDDLFKLACKRPKELKKKTVKNISKDVFGNVHGRIHIPKQKLSGLQTRKMKGLKKTPSEKAAMRKRRAGQEDSPPTKKMRQKNV